MSDFPDSIFAPRTKANRSGVVYDADKETVIFAEDLQKLDAEVVALENELGLNPDSHMRRYVKPYHGEGSIVVTSATYTAGRVYLMLIEIPIDCFIDQITIVNAATIAGNIRVGIYGPIVTEDTAAGAPLVVESASVAHSGANVSQNIALAKTALARGRYYLAFQVDDATATIQRLSNQVQVLGWTQYYDRGGGYGAFTTPCPAVTNTASNMPGLTARLSKI
jgi:hypothetical protein